MIDLVGVYYRIIYGRHQIAANDRPYVICVFPPVDLLLYSMIIMVQLR